MFTGGFEKVAAPRWVKELQKKDLSALSAAYKSFSRGVTKTRTIRSLGSGGENLVDIVAHPEFGLSVRKIPLIEKLDAIGDRKRSIAAALHSKTKQGKFYNDIKNLTNNSPAIAQIKGSDNIANYFEYSAPSLKDKTYAVRHRRIGDKIGVRKFNEIQYGTQLSADQKEAALKKFNKKGGFLRRVAGSFDSNNPIKYQKFDKNELYPKLTTTEQNKAIEAIKKKYPNISDLRRVNFVGGKIVDMRPEKPFTTWGSKKNSHINIQNDELETRRVFLGHARNRELASMQRAGIPLTPEEKARITSKK